MSKNIPEKLKTPEAKLTPAELDFEKYFECVMIRLF